MGTVQVCRTTLVSIRVTRMHAERRTATCTGALSTHNTALLTDHSIAAQQLSTHQYCIGFAEVSVYGSGIDTIKGKLC